MTSDDFGLSDQRWFGGGADDNVAQQTFSHLRPSGAHPRPLKCHLHHTRRMVRQPTATATAGRCFLLLASVTGMKTAATQSGLAGSIADLGAVLDTLKTELGRDLLDPTHRPIGNVGEGGSVERIPASWSHVYLHNAGGTTDPNSSPDVWRRRNETESYNNATATRFAVPNWYLKLRYLDASVSELYRGFDASLRARRQIEEVYAKILKQAEKPLGGAIEIGRHVVAPAQMLYHNLEDPRCPPHAFALQVAAPAPNPENVRFWICVHKRYEVPEQQLKTEGFTQDCAKLPTLVHEIGPEVVAEEQHEGAAAAGDNKANIFLDIGANIGYCTLLMASLGYLVMSFEPLRESFELIKASVALNAGMDRKVLVFNVALGSESGKLLPLKVGKVGNRGNTEVVGAGAGFVDVDENPDFDVATLHSGVEPHTGGVVFFQRNATDGSVKQFLPGGSSSSASGPSSEAAVSLVPQFALRDILALAGDFFAPSRGDPRQHNPIGLVKIDAEGSELDVLRGLGTPVSAETSSADVVQSSFICRGLLPRLKIELCPHLLVKRQAEIWQVLSFLDRHGYLLVEEDLTVVNRERDFFTYYERFRHKKQRDILAVWQGAVPDDPRADKIQIAARSSSDQSRDNYLNFVPNVCTPGSTSTQQREVEKGREGVDGNGFSAWPSITVHSGTSATKVNSEIKFASYLEYPMRVLTEGGAAVGEVAFDVDEGEFCSGEEQRIEHMSFVLDVLEWRPTAEFEFGSSFKRDVGGGATGEAAVADDPAADRVATGPRLGATETDARVSSGYEKLVTQRQALREKIRGLLLTTAEREEVDTSHVSRAVKVVTNPRTGERTLLKDEEETVYLGANSQLVRTTLTDAKPARSCSVVMSKRRIFSEVSPTLAKVPGFVLWLCEDKVLDRAKSMTIVSEVVLQLRVNAFGGGSGAGGGGGFGSREGEGQSANREHAVKSDDAVLTQTSIECKLEQGDARALYEGGKAKIAVAFGVLHSERRPSVLYLNDCLKSVEVSGDADEGGADEQSSMSWSHLRAVKLPFGLPAPRGAAASGAAGPPSGTLQIAQQTVLSLGGARGDSLVQIELARGTSPTTGSTTADAPERKYARFRFPKVRVSPLRIGAIADGHLREYSKHKIRVSDLEVLVV